MRFIKQLLTFADATTEDLPEVLAIEKVSFDNPWSRESFLDELLNPLTRITIAELPCNKIICGFSCCKVISPEAELLKVAVAPELRRQGVARSLLNETFRILQQQQVLKLYLEVSELNHGAIAFYGEMGFLPNGRRPGYYDNGTTAALLLKRNI